KPTVQGFHARNLLSGNSLLDPLPTPSPWGEEEEAARQVLRSLRAISTIAAQVPKRAETVFEAPIRLNRRGRKGVRRGTQSFKSSAAFAKTLASSAVNLRPGVSRCAFTLIEALVVIAIIA